MPPISFIEVLNRSLTGPVSSEKEFDYKVGMKLRELVKKYDIKYNPENPIPSDNSLADDVFKAAVEFYTDVGTYCMDTERRITFTEDEIKEGIKNVPHATLFGEGNEAKFFSARTLESSEHPWCHVGAGIAVSSEELLVKLVEAFASIPETDSVSVPTLTEVDGVPIRTPPLEVYGSIRMIALAHEAMKRAGRPGLPILNLVSTAASQIAGIAATAPQFGIKPTDGWLVDAFPDLKMYNDVLTKAAYLLNWGANIGACYTPLIGGYSGGPEGTAIMSVAYSINGIMVLKSRYQLYYVSNIVNGSSSSRDALWALSVSAQAISRNIKVPIIHLSYQAAGAATEMLLYEITAAILASVASGISVESNHPSKAVLTDHIIPMESEFYCKVAHAVTGMKRSEVNELAKILLLKYEKDLNNPPKGKKYQECYDVKTGKPKEEYLKFYKVMEKKIIDLGIQIE
ncbi:monomethylamine:corrinoid methyltransferase [Candidatus Bathyarchaeota archaeon]|nr:monomethylamine:corrinoid methyltransferase [Candidatus Bathyarchaeota archaeon]